MSNSTPPPYELSSQGGAGFIAFEMGDSVALPLFALASLTLRHGSRVMVFEFPKRLVVVEGEGLGALRDHVLSARVKTIRAGAHDGCAVKRIQLTEL